MKVLDSLKPNKTNIIYYCLLVVISFVFVLACSISTSPLYPDGYLLEGANDSSQFLTMGHEWLYGSIPYRDLFDHKGPYIFFVDMLGFALANGDRIGVFLLQIVNMSFIICGFDAIAKLCNTRIRYRLPVVIVAALIMRSTYACGNMTEEYCLPFIVFSTYFQLKYLLTVKTEDAHNPEGIASNLPTSTFRSISTCYQSRGNVNDHSPLLAFLYGLTFAVCFLTRITNFVTVCVGTLCVAFFLLRGKRFKNFALNALGFLIGTAALVVPFSIYFTVQGCFDEYIFATFAFNVMYSNAFSPWIIGASFMQIASYLLRTFAFTCAFLAGILFLIINKKRLAFYCLACWVFEAYLFFGSTTFIQYAAVAAAQTVILFNAASELKHAWGKILKIIIYVGLALLAVVELVLTVRAAHKALTIENPDLVPGMQLAESIPEEDRQNIMFLGDMWTKPLYLYYGIHPQYKYYNIQEWHSSFSDKVYDEVREQFATGDAKYVIAGGSETFLDDILGKRYELIDTNSGISLYELKDGTDAEV